MVRMAILEKYKDAPKLLSSVSAIYHMHFIGEVEYREQFSNGFRALEVFLKSYAHERQGRSIAYSKIAVETIYKLYNSGSDWQLPKADDSSKAWDIYSKIAKEKFPELGLNEKNNPMYDGQDKSVLSKLALNKIENIADYAEQHISEQQTKKAHYFIKTIRGVGNKIA